MTAGTGGRLAVLVKRFPRLSETFVLDEVLELRRQGLDLELFALLDPHEATVHDSARPLCDEVSYLRASDDWRGTLGAFREGFPTLFRYPIGSLRGIYFVLRRRRPATTRHFVEALVLVRRMRARGLTHLHAHFAHSPTSVAELVSLVSGIPYSFTAHAKDIYTTLPVNIARRVRNASFVVTCTDYNRRHIAELAGPDAQKVVVIHHGVDVDRFMSVPRRPVPHRILTVGRLIPKKGHRLLVDALATLSARHVPFEWRVIGGGPLRDDIQDHVTAAGIAAHTHIGGARTQDQIVAEFAQAEVFALTPLVMDDGDRDGIPNVLREAMAGAVPVVTTAVSGIPELVTNGITGWLVNAGDVIAIADALEQALIDAPARTRIAEAARAWVIAHEDLADSTAKLVALFAANGLRVSQPVRA